MSHPYEFIDTPEQYQPLIDRLARAETVVLDTEADSLHHYHQKICLVQVGLQGRAWLVDPLSKLDPAPLLEVLAHKELLMHGADYDLRMLYRGWGFRPARVFDTMLAAQLLGWEQVGLAALMERICGVEISKALQRADWSRRPLGENLLRYAADDVHYLPRVVAHMTSELEAAGRLEWHCETCERLIENACAPKQEENGEAWRIKGGRHLRGQAAAVLRELWHWRDRAARHADRPAFHVAGTDFLLLWAKWVGEHPGDRPEDGPAHPRWLRGRRREAFEQTLRQTLALPESKWPGPPPARHRSRLKREEEGRLERLIIARDAEARRLAIDPGVLAPRESLRQLIRCPPACADELDERSPLMRWQTGCLAAAIIDEMGLGGGVSEDQPGAKNDS